MENINSVEINFFLVDEYGTDPVGSTISLPANISEEDARYTVEGFATDVENPKSLTPDPEERNYQIFEDKLVVYLNIEDDNEWFIDYLKANTN